MTEQKRPRFALRARGARKGPTPTRSSARLAGIQATFASGLDSDKKKLALAVEMDVKGPFLDKESRARWFRCEDKVARYVLGRLDRDLKAAPSLCGKEFDRLIYNMNGKGEYPPNRNVPWETAFYDVDDVSKWDTPAKRLEEVQRVYNDLKAHCTALVANEPCTCSSWNHGEDFLYEGHESNRQSLGTSLGLDFVEDSDEDEPM
jgi:hypothetical protein